VVESQSPGLADGNGTVWEYCERSVPDISSRTLASVVDGGWEVIGYHHKGRGQRTTLVVILRRAIPPDATEPPTP